MVSQILTIDSTILWVVFVASLVAVWLIGIPMRKSNRALKSKGYSIVDYELVAFRSFSVADILEAWGTEGLRHAQDNLRLDFAFIPAYILSFASLTLIVARVQTGWLAQVGACLAITQIAAGLFDVVENVYLLSIISNSGEPVDSRARLASSAALLKFILLGAALLYILVGVVIFFASQGK